MIVEKRKSKCIISLILIFVLLIGVYPMSSTSYAEDYSDYIGSGELRHHIDIGVQIFYENSAGQEYEAEKEYRFDGSIRFNQGKPLRQTKATDLRKIPEYIYDIEGEITHNMPNTVAGSTFTKLETYKQYILKGMKGNAEEDADVNEGKFYYTGTLEKQSALNVTKLASEGRKAEVLKFWGNSISDVEPRVKDAVKKAIEDGENGDLSNPLYIVFCPMLITCEVLVPKPEVGKLYAKLEAPSSTKAGKDFVVTDISVIDESLKIERAELKRSIDGNEFESIKTVIPSVSYGQNSGLTFTDNIGDITTVKYKLILTSEDGQVAEDEKVVKVTDASEVKGFAELELPGETYENHPVIARDDSTFEIDGVMHGAAYAYNNGKASGNISIVGYGSGEVRKLDKTSSELTFPKQGTYTVELKVRFQGESDKDSQEIEVKKTPKVIDSLIGTQKENRKQKLNLSIAQNPTYPLTDVNIEIREKVGSEKLTASYDLVSNDTTFINTENIKARAIKKEESSKYYQNFTFEFLTKFSEEKEFEYKVVTKDTRGNTDTVTKTFTVRKDIKPTAKIKVANSFIREAGENFAYINFEEASLGDGDEVERKWYIKTSEADEYVSTTMLDNITSRSFGTDKALSWKKENGVGKVYLKLEVCEKWIEETLEEYIDSEDYLTDETEAETEVVNIAPRVEIELTNKKEVTLNFIPFSKEDKESILLKREDIKNALLEENIYASLNVQNEAYEYKGEETEKIFYYQKPYGIMDYYPFTAKEWYLVDDEKIYIIEPTFRQVTGSSSSYFAYEQITPITIKCYEVETRTLLWSREVSEAEYGKEVISLEDRGISQDDKGKFFFLISDSKTLIFDKENGNLLTSLNFVIGKENYFANENIYTFCEDGVYRIGVLTGKVDKITGEKIVINDKVNHGGNVKFDSNVKYTRLIAGEVVFLSIKEGKLKRAKFRLQDENISYIDLDIGENLAYENSYGNETKTMEIVGIGADGKIAITTNPEITDKKLRAVTFVYDKNGNILYETEDATSGHTYSSTGNYLEEIRTLPAWKSDDTFDYVVTMFNRYYRTSGKNPRDYYSVYFNTQNVLNGESYLAEDEKQLGDDAQGHYVRAGYFELARDIGNGKLELVTGAYNLFGDTYKSLYTIYENKRHSLIKIDFDARSFDIDYPSGALYMEYAENVTTYDGIGFDKYSTSHYKTDKVVLTDRYIIGSVSTEAYKKSYGGEGSAWQALTIYKRQKGKEESIIGKIEKEIEISNKSGSEKESSTILYDESLSGEEISNTFLEKLGEIGDSLIGIGGSEERFSNLVEKAKELKIKAENIVASAGGLASRIGNFFKDRTEYENVLSITKENGKESSSLKREIMLEPGREYFYEYEIEEESSSKNSEGASAENALTVNTEITNYEESLPFALNDDYVVTKIIEDDFSDKDKRNPYFNYSSSNVKWEDGRFLVMNIGNKGYTQSTTLTFDVPEGALAYIEFDYEAAIKDVGHSYSIIERNHEESPALKSQTFRKIYINDSQNLLPRKDSEERKFRSPYLLESGTNTIKFEINTYVEKGSSYYFYIDNLKVYLLSKDAEKSKLSHEDRVTFENGIKEVEGKISMPLETITYSGEECELVDVNTKENSNAIKELFEEKEYLSYSVTKDTSNNHSVLYEISPENMKLASFYSEFYLKTDSSDANAYIRLGESELASVRNNEVENKTYTYTLPSLEESLGFTLQRTGKSKSSAKAIFNRITYYEVPDEKYHERIASNDFFADGNRLYFKNEEFDGKTILTFTSKANKWHLKDFRLYYTENGKRVYVIDETNMSKDSLKNYEVINGNVSFGKLVTAEKEAEIPALLYKKGQAIAYNIHYSDYENDPSQGGEWIYAQETFNDGIHENTGIVLDDMGEIIKIGDREVLVEEYRNLTIEEALAELRASGNEKYLLKNPIEKFYIDGKYTVYHFEKDDTSRGSSPNGNPDYDKESNYASIVFYIGSSTSAPWIESISTSPKVPKEMEEMSLVVKIDDAEKDILSLVTEIYKDRKLIHTHRKKDIEVVEKSGEMVYPSITTDKLMAEAGKYEVICTVRDSSSVGIEIYEFTIKSEGKVTGSVTHTAKWNENRKAYNRYYFDDEGIGEIDFESYKSGTNLKRRYENVFWTGEKFMLKAEVMGNAKKVTCKIKGTNYEAILTNTGRKNEKGEWIYEGELWHKDFIYKWGMKNAEELCFVFRGEYGEENAQTHERTAIVDDRDKYSLLHRTF